MTLSRLVSIGLIGVLLAACSAESPKLAWRQTDLSLETVAEARGRFSTYSGRSIRTVALSSRSGISGAVFPIQLAATPTLSFRPIVEQGQAIRFKVELLRVTGDPEVLYDESHDGFRPGIPDLVALDLSSAAGEPVSISLLCEATGPGDWAAHFGSPRVIDTTPLEHRALKEDRSKPDVLLIAVDTLRADALGAYGRTPSVSPNIDALASESQLWLDAFATANNTNPSLASLMTGLYPKDHGLFNLHTRLPASHHTLAEQFRAEGYQTVGVVSAAHIKNSGLDQGFDHFVRSNGQFYAETVVDTAIDWLQRERAEPAFIWLHFFDPHVPHTPPAPYARGFAPVGPSGMEPVSDWAPYREPGVLEFDPRGPKDSPGHRRLYPGEVAYLDRQLGRLLDFLRSRGALDHTLVALVADHGETLGERQSWFRHEGLYDETTRVPLMIRWPGGEPRGRIPGLVQHFDLNPTLLETIGVDATGDARTLRRPPDRNAVFANHANDRGHMIRTDRHLFVLERGTRTRPRTTKFYDLVEDPRATRDLTGNGDPLEAELGDRLGSWRATRRSYEAAEPVAIDEAERAQLRALGYGD